MEEWSNLRLEFPSRTPYKNNQRLHELIHG